MDSRIKRERASGNWVPVLWCLSFLPSHTSLHPFVLYNCHKVKKKREREKIRWAKEREHGQGEKELYWGNYGLRHSILGVWTQGQCSQDTSETSWAYGQTGKGSEYGIAPIHQTEWNWKCIYLMWAGLHEKSHRPAYGQNNQVNLAGDRKAA